jgi:ElaA protein
MTARNLQWQAYRFDELNTQQLYQILRLRQLVFIIEQDCLYPDLDDLDQQSVHLCAWKDGELLAYLRSLPPGLDYAESALGRILVSERARGLKLGRELVQRGVALNQRTWPGSDIKIGAQAYLEKFYQDLGFETIGEIYIEDGIPHIKMLLGTA